MGFLLQSNVEKSIAAQEKLLADFRTSPDPSQITVLLYVIKSTKTSRYAEVLSEKYDFFGWGAAWKSEIPEEAVWVIDKRKFAIQDDRWEPHEKLFLDVVGGQFRMMPRTSGTGS